MATLGKPVFGGWFVAFGGTFIAGVSIVPIGCFGLVTGGFFGFDRKGLVMWGALADGSFGAGILIGI